MNDHTTHHPTELDLVLDVLDQHKAKDVVSLDVRDRSTLFDHIVICTGTSSRHVQSLAKSVQSAFKPLRTCKPRMEGYPYGQWLSVDCDHLVVHVFQEEMRAFYQLESLWRQEHQAA